MIVLHLSHSFLYFSSVKVLFIAFYTFSTLKLCIHIWSVYTIFILQLDIYLFHTTAVIKFFNTTAVSKFFYTAAAYKSFLVKAMVLLFVGDFRLPFFGRGMNTVLWRAGYWIFEKPRVFPWCAGKVNCNFSASTRVLWVYRTAWNEINGLTSSISAR